MTAYIRCLSCDEVIERLSTACPFCGKNPRQVPEKERCRYCGGKLNAGTDLKETNLVVIRCQDCGRINEVV